MKIVLIDNYDSFTYNLLHLAESIVPERVTVLRNDQYELSDLAPYDKILLSPGPGLPSEAGKLLASIQHYAAHKSIFGVCLGMQAIGEAFGGSLLNLPSVYHGVATTIHLTDPTDPLFAHCPQQFLVGRYHSWVVDAAQLPTQLHPSATDQQGYIMALRHRHWRVCGVQFHPESVLTQYGKQILSNWLLDS